MIAGTSQARPRTIDDLIGAGLARSLERMDIVSRRMFSGKLPGERRSKRRGRSVEFDDYRVYVPGDDLRHVDWNVLARFDRFVVKLFREDQDLSLHLFVDASASMDAGEPSKLIFGHRLAMAVGYIGLANQNRVSLTVYRGQGRVPLMLAPVRGRASAARLAGALLESFEPGRDDGPADRAIDFNGALRAGAASRTGSGVTLVISDFLVREGYTPGLNSLFGAGGFDTTCVQVLSPGELDPVRERDRGFVGDLRITDAESGLGEEITASPALLVRYRAAVEKYCQTLRRECHARGFGYVLASTETAVEELVLGSLRRLGVLR